MNYGIYIHIPFCRRKCDYCNFNSIPIGTKNPEKNEKLTRYLTILKIELDSRLKQFPNCKFDTIYFGGGTPSILNSKEIFELIEFIKCRVDLSDKSEISLEMNPEDADENFLTSIIDAGINRATLGIQTQNKNLNSVIGRSSDIIDPLTLDHFFSQDRLIHCIDLIAGIPHETESDLSNDLKKIIKYSPEHISVYLLTIENNTRLAHRIKYDYKLELQQKKNYYQTRSILMEAGYRHYEISNFAFSGFESRHNLKYWKFMPYIGFGPGAHSFYNNRRFYNSYSIDDYLKNNGPVLIEDNRNENSSIAEFIMTGLRLTGGLSIKKFEDHFGNKFPEQLFKKITELSDNGDLYIEGSDKEIRIRLTDENLIMADSIIYSIVEPVL